MDKLAAVREKFILSLQEKAEELEATMNMAISSGSHKELNAIIHKIAGSAGFYGETDIAAAATSIDNKLKDSANLVLTEQLQQDVHKLLGMLRHGDSKGPS